MTKFDEAEAAIVGHYKLDPDQALILGIVFQAIRDAAWWSPRPTSDDAIKNWRELMAAKNDAQLWLENKEYATHCVSIGVPVWLITQAARFLGATPVDKPGRRKRAA